MCSRCVPSEAGYVEWNSGNDAFNWLCIPSRGYVMYLTEEFGPIDLDIPYV